MTEHSCTTADLDPDCSPCEGPVTNWTPGGRGPRDDTYYCERHGEAMAERWWERKVSW